MVNVRCWIRDCCSDHGEYSNDYYCLIQGDGFNYLDAPLQRVTGADIPMPYAKNLEDLSLPQIDTIVRIVKKVCYKN